MNGFVVQLESGCWLAAVSGDPGRTIVRANATVFPDEAAAVAAMEKARQFRPFQRAVIYGHVPPNGMCSCGGHMGGIGCPSDDPEAVVLECHRCPQQGRVSRADFMAGLYCMPRLEKSEAAIKYGADFHEAEQMCRAGG